MTALTRDGLARLVARQLPRQGFVNLGIGAPTHIADYLPADTSVILHSENGILNVGPKPREGHEDYDLINAGKSPITIGVGGAFFDSSLAFAMMRGGHLDVAVLGAFEVSERGDIANWTTGRNDGAPPAIGGAIDLAVGAKEIWVMMEHVTKTGAPRLVQRCTYPLTAAGVVKRVYTNLAALRVSEQGFVVDAMVEGLSLQELQQQTDARLSPAAHLATLELE
ncbi:3-oxoacid CoA-transferase subunit B [Candidimonas nitroreducens]|uniref:3-oxoadipate CoA-transferase n=1 Tax=Candidimonas nitroreducens TaxID=683354 RepID=A0A225MZ82_9BURK|nr:3-oxoacid CoA-transferase subunit B [Candidimonas nitroreducens]OWT66382.1 3-oxoadipate CoA-transferase [Candidimonas nitroreducens]